MKSERIAEILDRFELTLPSWPRVPETWAYFRSHIEQREEENRLRFNDAFMHRDNIAYAQRKTCDGAVYVMFDGILAGAQLDEDIATTLTALEAFWHAHEMLGMLAAKRSGSP